MKLSLRPAEKPTAAPPWFPYDHASLATVWAHEQSVATAVENYVSEATKAADSSMKLADVGGAANTSERPDQTLDRSDRL